MTGRAMPAAAPPAKTRPARPLAARKRPRRSLSQANLETRQEGPQGPLLARALQVPEQSPYFLTHAFHPYPGRFHPQLARTLLAGAVAGKEQLPLPGLARPGQSVLDPFMGGGTTLVEGLLAGLDVVGSDLNPIAVLVARERTRLRTPAQAIQVLGEARRIAGQVEALRRERNAPRAHLSTLQRITPHYAPHLLAELMQWLRLVNGLPAADARETLRAVFSSAVVKFSNQASDSTPEARPSPSVAKGAVSRFLVAKCEQLVQAQVDLARRVPRRAQVRLLQEDARLLPSLGWGEVDWILTSPPYPGVYDYHQHHRLRMDWLELDDQPLLQGELAPRREQASAAQEPARSLSAGFRDVLGTLARVLKPGGGLLLVVGDWLDAGHAVDGAAVLRRAAQDKGWRVDAWASVRREAHSRPERRAYARQGKWEHLLLFGRP